MSTKDLCFNRQILNHAKTLQIYEGIFAIQIDLAHLLCYNYFHDYSKRKSIYPA